MAAERLPEVVWPPEGFTDLGWHAAVISNFDHLVNPVLAIAVRAGGCFGRHAAWEFNGNVWFDGGRWHELVCVLGEQLAAFVADTPEELMKIVNDEHGWG